MILSRVVLPDPDGPTKEKSSPTEISKFTWLKTANFPNCFEISSSLTPGPCTFAEDSGGKIGVGTGLQPTAFIQAAAAVSSACCAAVVLLVEPVRKL